MRRALAIVPIAVVALGVGIPRSGLG
jgi:hypothetical protein